ncbi:MAG TPA: LytTR family DNA-binding domain-containing protein, partial [Sphingomicrobium sp.]|nr:LytTR family DNA-binding domain-containing protein [Sphingomicrobium sp.]
VASLIFSSLHILIMNAMRVAIYAMIGRHYVFGEQGFWYEYRKDLIAYVIWAAVFWYFTRKLAPVAAPNGRRLIDIRDGKRLLRVPLDEIVAIRAAGNYVEFLLVDDRRPLARQSLSVAQQALGHEFVRTHRSWAINAAHVRALRAVGAGDYEVELACGLKAPLSRRFPQALQRLRQPVTVGVHSAS